MLDRWQIVIVLSEKHQKLEIGSNQPTYGGYGQKLGPSMEDHDPFEHAEVKLGKKMEICGQQGGSSPKLP